MTYNYDKLIVKITVGIVYCMFGMFPLWTVFFHQYLTCIMISLTSSSYGCLVSALAPTAEIANDIGIMMMGPLLIFGGLFILPSTIPLYFIWVKYLSWSYYGFQNFMINQWAYGGFCIQTAEVLKYNHKHLTF